MFTEKKSSKTSFIVSEIPSKHIDPFEATNFLYLFGYFILKTLLFFDLMIESISPKRSTWPVTRCPPTSSPNFKLFSKLILVWFFQNFTEDLEIVSCDTSKQK